jgi:hypothetical protein
VSPVFSVLNQEFHTHICTFSVNQCVVVILWSAHANFGQTATNNQQKLLDLRLACWSEPALMNKLPFGAWIQSCAGDCLNYAASFMCVSISVPIGWISGA